ncbi:stalk domain-containing protein [Brevibacillus formosus]|uniref:stalk domain-containing protein n=1 Tax=Brevibacillus formosus TaxID=54913 RepID=UPI001F1A0752|nr:stalk domain-containing protein [Brevibacillus formosus]
MLLARLVDYELQFHDYFLSAFPMDKFRSDYSQYLQMAVGKVDKPKQVPVAISLNGSLLSMTGFLQEGVSMLPVRAVANAVGGKVEWIAATQDVRVNGKDLNEKLISGSVYAPTRELAAGLCLQIEWDGSTNTVILRGCMDKTKRKKQGVLMIVGGVLAILGAGMDYCQMSMSSRSRRLSLI